MPCSPSIPSVCRALGASGRTPAVSGNAITDVVFGHSKQQAARRRRSDTAIRVTLEDGGNYRGRNGGAEGIRTPDPKTASLVLSQLSYSPTRTITLQGSAKGCQGMVPEAGFEPARPCGHGVLSAASMHFSTPARSPRIRRGLIVHPACPRSSHGPRRSVSKRPEERFPCRAFPCETRNGPGIVDPAK